MKKLYTLLAVLLITASTFAQAPESMTYQAVVRDSEGNLVANKEIGMQISILKGNAPGTAVYVETQTPTSNVNGLVTLEIGGSTTTTDKFRTHDFTTIDWSADTYFIKTETDPAGGTDYTITGTSQLLSVPYALHAKTAGSATETQTIADVASLGNSLNNKQLKDVTDPTDAQDAATKAYVDVLETKLTALATRITALEPATVGDLRAGGVVFWVDPTDNTHGLVCAFSDYANDVDWGCDATDLPNVINVAWNNGIPEGDGAEIGHGKGNTNSILNDCPPSSSSSTSAAEAARTLGSEWFLPSAKELNDMYENKTTLEKVSGFVNFSTFYWSSSEYNIIYAWAQGFNGFSQSIDFKDKPLSVRAVRAF
jgi:hypothetical protein